MDWANLLFVLITACHVVQSIYVSRVSFDGILLEDPHPRSKSLLYSTTLRDTDSHSMWRNMTTLQEKSGFKSKSLFCTLGNGGWILYPDENFTARSSLSLIIVVGDACTKTSKVQSLQPLGPLNRPSQIHVFEAPYFASEAKPYKTNMNFTAKSVIFSTSSNWTMKTYRIAGNHKSIMVGSLCFLGIPSQKDQYQPAFCCIPDIEVLFDQHIDKVNFFPGCTNKTTEVNMSCYHQGNTKVLVEREFTSTYYLSSCPKFMSPIRHRQIQELTIISEMWEQRMKLWGNLNTPTQSESMIISPASPAFFFKIFKQCPALDHGYVMTFAHILEQITKIMLTTRNGSFSHTFREFALQLRDCRFSPAQTSANSNSTSNCSIESFDSTIEQFIDHLTRIFQLLGQRCLPSPSGSAVTPALQLDSYVQTFLRETKLNWNIIYEFSMNGIDIKGNQKSMVNCINNFKIL